MNVFRTFTRAHDGLSLTLRADAVDAFHPSHNPKNTTIYLRGSPDGCEFIVAEDMDTVQRWLEDEKRT
jgi:hypothetical protein